MEPRFPGGTGGAVAAEIRALHGLADIRVFAVESAMFKDRRINQSLQTALEDAGIDLVWNAPVIRADTVVFHNPSCLKFNQDFGTRISCQHAYIVTQENFLRPNGSEGFDVTGCLSQIERALVCGQRLLAPVSRPNRRGVAEWQALNETDWSLAEFDWFHIFDHALVPPTPAPRDRRGRHSRAGFEKFPPLDTMVRHFPAHAETCRILGGDSFLLEPEAVPPHWDVLPFGGADVAEFLASLDFFVYFTHPNWRESYGRVIAEAIAAGKLVITDAGTAESFGDAVIASDGNDVDAIVQHYIDAPDRYTAFVRAAQDQLTRHRPEAFATEILRRIGAGATAHAAP